MDVNGTKFHSLIGKPDWTSDPAHLSAGVLYDEQDAGIRLRSRLFRPDTDQLATPLIPSQRRGAAGDRYGNIFWLDDEQHAIWFLSRQGGAPLSYWSLDDWYKEDYCDDATGDFKPAVHIELHQPSYLQALAITRYDYLVAGILEPAGLLVFDLHAGNPPNLLLWPQDISFTPIDMAPASDGGLWILDSSSPPDSGVWTKTLPYSIWRQSMTNPGVMNPAFSNPKTHPTHVANDHAFLPKSKPAWVQR